MAGIRKKVGKKEIDLGAMVESGPQGAYEASQLYRSRAMRFKTKHDVRGAYTLIAEGAQILLKNGYESSGFELGNLFLELVNENNLEPTEELRKLVHDIDDQFPQGSSSRAEFLKGVVRWSMTTGKREYGDPVLQMRLGECLWNLKDKTAAHHFAAGEAPTQYCALIFSTYKEAAEQDKRDQSLTLGITNFLAMENLRDAHELMFHFKNSLKSKKLPGADSKLLQFNEYLLATSRRDAAPLFKQLVNEYASDLDFDEAVPSLLMGPIASKLFGIKPKVSPMMSVLNSIISA
mmetsp:Transcript_32800/g.55304  ORF Transcript_32800/g.55304 Transcript_32800/m.55304 type:complete len:291 (-) Transcript_32800:121-993(-)